MDLLLHSSDRYSADKTSSIIVSEVQVSMLVHRYCAVRNVLKHISILGVYNKMLFHLTRLTVERKISF